MRHQKIKCELRLQQIKVKFQNIFQGRISRRIILGKHLFLCPKMHANF